MIQKRDSVKDPLSKLLKNSPFKQKTGLQPALSHPIYGFFHKRSLLQRSWEENKIAPKKLGTITKKYSLL
jgi:hypothetical protein